MHWISGFTAGLVIAFTGWLTFWTNQPWLVGGIVIAVISGAISASKDK